MTEEYISTDPRDPNWFICLCGNNPEYEGFYACDIHGNAREPDERWDGHYCCFSCGRIIDPKTLKVIGSKQR